MTLLSFSFGIAVLAISRRFRRSRRSRAFSAFSNLGPVFFSSRTEINGPVPGQSVKVDIDIVCETKYFVGLNFAVSASGISVNYPPVKHE